MRLAFVIDPYWPFMTPSARVLDVVIRHLLFEGHEVQLLTVWEQLLHGETQGVHTLFRAIIVFGQAAKQVLLSKLSLTQLVQFVGVLEHVAHSPRQI